MSPKDTYSSSITTAELRLLSLRRRLNGISIFRLALFAALAWSIWAMITHWAAWLPWAGLALAAGFLASVSWYIRVKDQRNLWQQLLFVNTNEREVLLGSANEFPDGAAFLDQDNYLDDLDIFGKRSLFHLLNRTTTTEGANVLANMLRSSYLSAADIQQQQKAIGILTPQTDQRRLLIATGLLAGKMEPPQLERWLQTPLRLQSRAFRWLLLFLTIVNLILVGYYFYSNNSAPLLFGVLLSWGITGRYLGYINEQHHLISRKHALLAQYAGVLDVFNTFDTSDSDRLQQLQKQTLQAVKSMRQLSRLSSFFDQRLNMLVNIFLNTFFFYDLHVLSALERWKIKNKDRFAGWMDAIGQIEALNSLAAFAFNNPEFVYPEASESTPASSVPPPTSTTKATHPNATTPISAVPAANQSAPLFIEAAQLAHPLIPAGKRIANDFSIGRNERLILVTGSNMSGKTTFLRTIGVNLLLAQCGAPVCASSFRFTPVTILTSLRISDSLQENTSYFMAELKKLQKIVHRLQTGAAALVLIDEILRGTNSEDKTFGSEMYIRKLLQYHSLSLFATHDLSLGQLENTLPGDVSNYCFESIIENGSLHFNYRLGKGVARNRNASFLMQQMEII